MTSQDGDAGGSEHSVAGANPQDRLPNPSGDGNNDTSSTSTTNPNSSTTGTQSSPTGAGDADQGSSSTQVPGPIGRHRATSLPPQPPASTNTSSALATLANLRPEERQLVEVLARGLAGQIVSQGVAAAGVANGSDSSTTQPAAENPEDKIIFKTAAETHVARYQQDAPIHPEISTLARSGVRPPLTLFSVSALNELHADPAIRRKKYTLAGGSKTLIDVGAFGREDELESEDWKECWKGHLRWLGDTSDPAIHNRWSVHFDTLCGLPYFKDEFSAIRSFDISERTLYFNSPYPHSDDIWWARLGSARQEASAKEARNEIRDLKQVLNKLTAPVRTERSSSNRSHPYQSSSSSSPSRSFPAGKSATATRRLCIRCGRPNELASSCTQATTIHGRPIVANWDTAHRTLVSARDSKVEFCFDFNIGGPDRCKGEHAPRIRHACSICGADSHHAASGNCPT